MFREAVPIIAFVSLAGLQPVFTFAGIGLNSNLESVAAAYPHSNHVGEYLYVAPQDRRQHMAVVELSGSGATRRLRISFEIPGRGGQPVYPKCAAVHKGLADRYGPPVAVRNFDEESSRRSDRVWQSSREEMTLVCFRRPGQRRTSEFLAEAVVIHPR
jgi:hypothetical protein